MGSLLRSGSFHAFVVWLDEGQFAHGNGYALASYLREQGVAGSRLGADDVSHGNRRVDARTEAARGHLSDRGCRLFIAIKLATAADWGAISRTKSNALARGAFGKLLQNDIGAGKPTRARATSAAAF